MERKTGWAGTLSRIGFHVDMFKIWKTLIKEGKVKFKKDKIADLKSVKGEWFLRSKKFEMVV